MRRIGHALLLILVLGLSAWAIYGLNAAARSLFAGSVPGLDARSVRPIETIELASEKWVRFALPRRGTRIRVSLFAALEDLGGSDVRTVSVDYRVQSQGSDAIKRVHTVVRPGSYEIAVRNRNVIENQQKFAVVRATELFIDIPEMGATRALELRVAAIGPGIKAMMVRVAERIARDDAAARLAWQRYSAPARDRVAASSFAPASMLKLEDGARFLRVDYEPIGPDGIKGRDFNQRSVYESREESDQDDEPQIASDWPVASPSRPLVFESANETEWDVAAIDSTGAEAPFEWRVNGRSVQRFARKARIRMQATHAELAPVRNARIKVTDAVSMRTVESGGIGQTFVQISSGTITSYKLIPVGGRSLPFRLEFRQREAVDIGAQTRRVTVKGLDERGSALWEESVELDTKLAVLDRLSVTRLEALTVPVRRQWLGDKSLREVRISTAGNGILVAAYAGLETANSASATEVQWIPRWPEDIDQRRIRGELLVASVQSTAE
jgi:hypothetical protein